QRGSKVVRGNLLVIPIERSVLYVEPLYLLAERSELPELRRVLVAFGDSVAMGDTLDDALRKVFAQASDELPEPKTDEGIEIILRELIPETADSTLKTLVEDAIEAYNKADGCLTRRDFAGFGKHLDDLGRLLEELKERTE
ncbi:MAG: UPF0182 family protein, partial [Firmicutes bacterium]|nr:UPF0182 family protein [Bacillota bacterium]